MWRDSREQLESEFYSCGHTQFVMEHIICYSTPLIKLNRLSEATGCTIAVKAEHLNPGGSVKDRAALYLIKEAEEKGCYNR